MENTKTEKEIMSEYQKYLRNEEIQSGDRPFIIKIGNTANMYHNGKPLEPISKEVFKEAVRLNALKEIKYTIPTEITNYEAMLNKELEDIYISNSSDKTPSSEKTKGLENMQSLLKDIVGQIHICNAIKAPIDYIVIYTILETLNLTKLERAKLLSEYLTTVVKAKCEFDLREGKEHSKLSKYYANINTEDNLAIEYYIGELSQARISKNEKKQMVDLANFTHRLGIASTIGSYKKSRIERRLPKLVKRKILRKSDANVKSLDCSDPQSYIDSFSQDKAIAYKYNFYRNSAQRRRKPLMDVIRIKTIGNPNAKEICNLAEAQRKQEIEYKKNVETTYNQWKKEAKENGVNELEYIESKAAITRYKGDQLGRKVLEFAMAENEREESGTR